ncbi:NADPH-dependent FMN reductase [Acetobacterium paludosum]|uniref:NADPH-dependent FMN reductase n=2 Tax=Acetobacterium TaxID=33951 RepID=A0A923KRN9_9FIRM|nr:MULTISPECIES: NAD(P)H-dependent oxidoreductase [Acetobacterium]MBC3796040.1 NADPH-dependent FMN reductase [Acetobacterium tundrae]MBC3887452.1 NADPH-dependent FMN reductase [Acetobacterium paludosum]
MTKIGIILGSTRPGRNGEAVAKWVNGLAQKRTDATFELVDVADYNLPLLDEPNPAMMQQYTKEHTKVWSKKISEFDGFIFVTAEYNHSIPGALKNAIDYLNVEWQNKAVGFVAYGSAGGTRSVEALRLVAAELHMADVRAQVMLNLFTDFQNMNVFTPDPRNESALNDVFDQVIAWSGALKTLRV